MLDAIDPEILALCQVINETGLFETTASCAGHRNPSPKVGQVGPDNAFVVFRPISDDVVARERFLQQVCEAAANRPWHCEIHTTHHPADVKLELNVVHMLSLWQPRWKTRSQEAAKKLALEELPRLLRGETV